MLSKIYLETTNVCNLSCSFCHKTTRQKRFMSLSEFETVTDKIKGKSRFLYLHLMGEPLLQPHLSQMAHIAKQKGFDVMLTTNGSLLAECGEFIYKNGDIKKVSISLQASEIHNKAISNTEKYISDVSAFAKECAGSGVICVLRLWNLCNGKNQENDKIHELLHKEFPDKWIKNRSGFKLFDSPKGKDEVYLEYGEKFDWPDANGNPERDVTHCLAITDQIGILCDGTVVPCCLDADGEIALGNIFESSFEEILCSERAQKLISSFEKRCPSEKLSRTCGFAERFSK